MPVIDGCRLTSKFGKRDIDFGPTDHWGLDFGGRTPGESTWVKAAAAGEVVWIKTIPLRSGPCIGIKHPDGSLTNYVHTRNHKVRVGQKVERGEIIAETWHTGIRIEAGIHLHFEWWRDWTDHRSVFDPTQRLADYGWVLKWDAAVRRDRLHDEWEGRSHASASPVEFSITPAALTTPASTEGELTVSQYEDLKKDIADLTLKVEAILKSTSTPVIKDSANGDSVTVAGALTRVVALNRRIETAVKSGEGCKCDHGEDA